jgi:CubicO group peptidase (beta-lactamase class C family)
MQIDLQPMAETTLARKLGIAPRLSMLHKKAGNIGIPQPEHLIDPKSPPNHPTGSKQARRQGAYAILIVGLLSLLGSLLAQDQTPAPSPPQIEKKQLDALTPAIQRKFEELKIWGLAIAVGRAGHILYEHGFGFKDADKLKPIDPETHFEIGSITKQFTAAAILQLKEQGKLSLDDGLAKYVPTFPHGSDISIRQLLNQTSGLADYFCDKGIRRARTRRV